MLNFGDDLDADEVDVIDHLRAGARRRQGLVEGGAVDVDGQFDATARVSGNGGAVAQRPSQRSLVAISGSRPIENRVLNPL